MEKCKWPNVRNVEQMSQNQRRRGKWQVAQIRWERECNWKSGFMNAQMDTASAKCLAKRRSKQAGLGLPVYH